MRALLGPRRTPAGAVVAILILLCPPAAPRAGAQTSEADVFVAQAVVDFDDKRYDAALANLRRALEIQPDHVEALYYTGVVEMARGRPAAAVPPLERAHALAPTDVSVTLQLGLAYFAQQQYDRARPLLEEAFRTDPKRDGLGYYVGFMRYRQKDYRSALAAFRAGATKNPDIEQLTRFYTSLALGALGSTGEAAAEVEQALRLAPGSALTGAAERLREGLAVARSRERRLSLDVRLGFFFDDNVTVVPDLVTSEPLVRGLRQRAHESTGELAGLNAGYAWLRTENWESTVGGSFFGIYNNDLPEFNIYDFVGSLGLTRKLTLGAMPALAGLQYSFDELVLDESEFLLRNTVSLSGTLVEGEHHLSQAFVRYQKKDFREPASLPSVERRSADNWAAGAVHLLRFSHDQHFLKAGYQFDWEDADGKDFQYYGNRFLAGAQYTLPWKGVRLKYDLDAHLRTHLHRNSLFPTTAPDTKRRYDAELTHTVRAELPLSGSLTLAAEYLRTDDNSNLAVFAYARNVYSLTLSWSY